MNDSAAALLPAPPRAQAALAGGARAGATAVDLLRRDLAALLPAGLAGRLAVGAAGAAPGESVTTAPDGPASLTVRLTPTDVVVAVTPGAPGPCPGCLDLRWLHLRPDQERDALERELPRVLTPQAPVDPRTVAVLAALLRAAGRTPAHPGARRTPARPDDPTPVWSVSRSTQEIHRYRLLRSSDCPRCAVPPADAGARVAVEAVPVAPGASRARTPEQLDLPLDALANPVCGAIGGPAMRAYQATASAPTTGRFTVRSKYGLHDMWWSGHAESYARSELLGVLEGLERSAGQYNRRLPARWASADELEVPFVDLAACGTYSDEFYARHAEQHVPWETRPVVPWVHGWSLRDDRAVLVPEQLVYYLDRRPGVRTSVQECSNGCASGASLTEAVLHGLLELVERDAFLLSWYTGRELDRIDLDTVGSPLVAQMRGCVELLGYELRCFDVRLDVRVPAVGAVAVRRDGGPGTLCFAGGASLDPASAVQAAVCEVAAYVPGFADRVASAGPDLAAMAHDHRRVARLEDHALLFGLPEMGGLAPRWTSSTSPVRALDDVFADWTSGRAPTTDLGAEVHGIVGLLAGLGLDTVVVDQTTPEQLALGVRTACVVVPGLVPIDFGWERQRVLTMPRTLAARTPGEGTTAVRDPGDLVRIPHPFP